MKKGRKGMPKGMPRTKMETTDALPLVSSKRGKYRELERCELDAQVHADLMEYVEFVKDADGEEPKVGGIVSAALERLFDADAGFPKWRENKRNRARVESKETTIAAATIAASANGNGSGRAAKANDV
jgi:hypothetical protein